MAADYRALFQDDSNIDVVFVVFLYIIPVPWQGSKAGHLNFYPLEK
jgi:hypothetical protein